MQIGGGIAAGLGLLGAGIGAYRYVSQDHLRLSITMFTVQQHEKKEEEVFCSEIMLEVDLRLYTRKRRLHGVCKNGSKMRKGAQKISIETAPEVPQLGITLSRIDFHCLNCYIRVLVHGKQIPPGAIVAGRLGGQPVFIARAFYEGGVRESCY